MPIDNSITKRLNEWLAKTDRTFEDVISGATLLLQLNRNRQLFQTVMTNPKHFESTVVYELKKFVPIRQRGQTLEDVQNDAKQLLGELKTIKSLYNTCLGITEPCDLAESLNTLKETWYKYKSEFARYDDFIVENNDETVENGEDPADSAKAITNARSYLSKMLKDDKLLNMKKASLGENAGEKAIEAYRSSLQNTQDRVLLLLDKGEVIGDDLRAKLAEAGVVFPEDEPSETVDPSENAGSTDDIKDEQGQEN